VFAWLILVVAFITTVEATALDLRLLQRSSSDAQNEHEKGHGNQDAHFAQVAVRSDYCTGDSKERLLRCGDAGLRYEALGRCVLYKSERVEEERGHEQSRCAVTGTRIIVAITSTGSFIQERRKVETGIRKRTPRRSDKGCRNQVYLWKDDNPWRRREHSGGRLRTGNQVYLWKDEISTVYGVRTMRVLGEFQGGELLHQRRGETLEGKKPRAEGTRERKRRPTKAARLTKTTTR